VAQFPLPKRQTAEICVLNCRTLPEQRKKEHLINSTTFENVPLMGKNDQLALTAKTKKITRRTNTKQPAKD